MFTHRATLSGEKAGRELMPHVPGWVSSFIILVALFGFTKLVLGAETGNDGADVIDASSVLESPWREVVYGLALVGICAAAVFVPDAPLLLCIFFMPMAQFVGVRIGLSLLQCAIVLARTGGMRYLVPTWRLLMFLVCAVASAAWALDPRESLFSESVGVTATLLQVPLAIAALSLLQTRLSSPRRMLWALTAGCLPGSVLTIYNALAGNLYVEGGKGYYMGFIRPDIFSPMLVMSGILLIVTLASANTNRRNKIIAGAMLPLICVALLLSGIRSGWIAFLLTAVLVMVWTRRFVVLAGIAGGALAIGVLCFAVSGDLGEQVSARLSENSLHSGEMRLEYWELAGRGFLKRPVLGIGWGSFPAFAGDNGVGRDAVTHNIFVRILCELGLVGLVLFGFWVTGNALQLRYCTDGQLVAILMVGVLVQGFFLDHFICSYFWLFLGLCDGVVGERRFQIAEQVENYASTLKRPAGQTAA